LAEPETLAASPQAALALVSASADAHDLVPEPAPTPQHPTEYREATDFRQKLAAVEAEQRGVDLDFDLDLNQQAAKQQQPNFPKPATLTESTDLALPDLDIFSAPEPVKTYPRLADFKPSAPALSPAPSAPELGALDFDLSSLSSLSRDSGEATRPAATDAGQDPLETKLALAHEFSAIGDEYGARALIEEVIAEATGAMKTKAERALRQRQAS
jgi:pilus assembly protein FimV